mmetsp:Transcript_6939/g.25569  ORF Transcript_6939/g.25569 Transcript_6939/m.25569 type:complete len:127 (-) Transcript_6939:1087-1467(-)
MCPYAVAGEDTATTSPSPRSGIDVDGLTRAPSRDADECQIVHLESHGSLTGRSPGAERSQGHSSTERILLSALEHHVIDELKESDMFGAWFIWGLWMYWCGSETSSWSCSHGRTEARSPSTASGFT